MILRLQADDTVCARFRSILRQASLNGSPTYALAFGKASAILRVALWHRSRTLFLAWARIRCLRRWSRRCRRDPFLCRSCFLRISASRLFRSWTVALISRPLTRTALSPSVAAMIVLTPEVHADRRARGSGLDEDLADDLHRAVAEPDLHHAAGQGDALGA